MSELVASMPFAERLGVQVEVATQESVKGGLDWKPELCTACGVLHGGVLMALADSLGAICTYLNLPAGKTTATIESKTNFFRGVRAGRISAESKPLHVGRTTIVVQTSVSDESGAAVALVIQTQAVLQ
jgi:uncharacterized protein (TIGR00369 family)